MKRKKTIKVIIPAHNEAVGIDRVISAIQALRIEDCVLVNEIIVCDNGSTDDTARIALKCGATVIYEPQSGYGIACLAALNKIESCDYVVFVSGDGAENVSEMPLLLEQLDSGFDLVIGSRALGKEMHGAQSRFQRWGNLIASSLINKFWNVSVTDLGPFRAVRYDVLRALDMKDKNYGWTAEMQVKAIILGFKTVEVPVTSLVGFTPSEITSSPVSIAKAGLKIIGLICFYGLFIRLAKLPWPISKLPWSTR